MEITRSLKKGKATHLDRIPNEATEKIIENNKETVLYIYIYITSP